MPRSSDNTIPKAQFTNDCSFTRTIYQKSLNQRWYTSLLTACLLSMLTIGLAWWQHKRGNTGLAVWMFFSLLPFSGLAWRNAWVRWKDMTAPNLEIQEDIFEHLYVFNYENSNAPYTMHLQKAGYLLIPKRLKMDLPPEISVYVVRTGYSKYLLDIRPQ